MDNADDLALIFLGVIALASLVQGLFLAGLAWGGMRVVRPGSAAVAAEPGRAALFGQPSAWPEATSSAVQYSESISTDWMSSAKTVSTGSRKDGTTFTPLS